MCVAAVAYAQPPQPPTPYNLSAGPFNFNTFDPATIAGTYPESMILLAALKSANPTATTAPIGLNAQAIPYSCIYSGIASSRIQGLADRGIQFVITSTALGTTNGVPNANCVGADTTASYPYALNLVLNTSGCTNINLSYLNAVTALGDGPTRTPPTLARQSLMGLAYRTSPTDDFTAFTDVVPFSTVLRTVAGDSAITNVTFPASLENLPVVELRWYFNIVSPPGSGGTRPAIRLDNINITATVNGNRPRLNAFNFSLAPNPSNGLVQVADSYQGAKTITVYNLLGAAVKTVSTVENNIAIDGLTTGMYLVEVAHANDNSIATQKLVVK